MGAGRPQQSPSRRLGASGFSRVSPAHQSLAEQFQAPILSWAHHCPSLSLEQLRSLCHQGRRMHLHEQCEV